MKKYAITLLSILIIISGYAQSETSRYLENAIPETAGKVIFKHTLIPDKPLSNDQLFSLMNKWVQSNYNKKEGKLENRILLSDASVENIACLGEKYLVFQKTALTLDRAKMMYQLIMEIKNGKCDVTIRNIKYEYADNKYPLTAEEMITDNIAFNKKKNKLNRYYDKFRIHTIDTVNNIFQALDVYLNGVKISGASNHLISDQTIYKADDTNNNETRKQDKVILTSRDIQEKVSETPVIFDGYRQISVDKIPGNSIKLFNEAMLITSGSPSRINVTRAYNGGIGILWEKPVTFCFTSSAQHHNETMDNQDTYTISFYSPNYEETLVNCGSVSGVDIKKIKDCGLTPIKTPTGSMAFSEAWMILECKKLVEQPFSTSGITDKQVSDKFSKNRNQKMYIGEILNVWVK